MAKKKKVVEKVNADPRVEELKKLLSENLSIEVTCGNSVNVAVYFDEKLIASHSDVLSDRSGQWRDM